MGTELALVYKLLLIVFMCVILSVFNAHMEVCTCECVYVCVCAVCACACMYTCVLSVCNI